MPVTPPIAPDKAGPEIKELYDRIAETIGDGEVPIGFQMMAHSHIFLQDSYMNNRKFIHDGTGKLDDRQREAVVLATSSAMNCVHCVRSHAKSALKVFSETEVAEILAVTATCAMYNTYYKFKDLADDKAFESTQPGLRAHTFQKTSLDDTLVEMINIAVSNINGCKMCTSGHVQKARKLGVTDEQIDEVIRVSAAMAAFNTYHRTQ